MRSFVICKQMDEMGGECGIMGRREMDRVFCWGNMEERNHCEDLGVDGRTILQVIKW